MDNFITQILPCIWGIIGGIIIEVVDFYWKIHDKESDYKEALAILKQKYPFRIAISAIFGGIITLAISMTPSSIWQIVIGMSALGIVSKFLHKD